MKIKNQIFILLFLIILISCVNQNNYQYYSFFFDGVPKPTSDSLKEATKAQIIQDTTKKIAEKQQNSEVIHPPYADRSCKDCHEFGKKMILKVEQPDLCYQCHNDLSKDYKVLHGPVAGGFCTSCHNPHSSKFEKLLITEKSSKLCVTCHEMKDVLANSIHSEDMNCFDCHNPHGGDDQSFQK